VQEWHDQAGRSVRVVPGPAWWADTRRWKLERMVRVFHMLAGEEWRVKDGSAIAFALVNRRPINSGS